MENYKNIFIAALVCAVVFLGVEVLRKPTSSEGMSVATGAVAGVESLTRVPLPCPPCSNKMLRQDALKVSHEDRVMLDSPVLGGSLLLKGGRLDDVVLKNYKTTPDKTSEAVAILSPIESVGAYYATFRWENVQGASSLQLPDLDTLWQTDHRALTPQTPVTLTWANDVGVRFSQKISLDGYMMTVVQKVENTTAEPISLRVAGLVERFGPIVSESQQAVHEGPLGVFQGRLHQLSYEKSLKPSEHNTKSLVCPHKARGWVGLTDKYWLAAMIPADHEASMGRFCGVPGDTERYEVEAFGALRTLAPGAVEEWSTYFFVGPKNLQLLDQYGKTYNISHFDLAVDFGWFYFLTKPLFSLLSFLHEIGGSFAFAILIMTVLMRVLFVPLSIKSHGSMVRLRALQPKMQNLRDTFSGDKVRMNQEILSLYKKEGVSPVSGCLPMLVQIPFLFALYKVLYISLEMRHAPFWGWIRDLSAPDPTNIFTLFGLIPWDLPTTFHLGAWPLLMGVSMWMQQKLSDSVTMDAHQRVMLLYVLPVVFSYMLAQFPVGLVIYWTWGNVLVIIQQWLLNKFMGRGEVTPFASMT